MNDCLQRQLATSSSKWTLDGWPISIRAKLSVVCSSAYTQEDLQLCTLIWPFSFLVDLEQERSLDLYLSRWNWRMTVWPNSVLLLLWSLFQLIAIWKTPVCNYCTAHSHSAEKQESCVPAIQVIQADEMTFKLMRWPKVAITVCDLDISLRRISVVIGSFAEEKNTVTVYMQNSGLKLADLGAIVWLWCECRLLARITEEFRASLGSFCRPARFETVRVGLPSSTRRSSDVQHISAVSVTTERPIGCDLL